MIFDLRIYDLRPGALAAYMAAVREVGLPVRLRHGVRLVSWYYTEIGPLHRVFHTWAYRDWRHLEEAKARFRVDPEWRERYLPRVYPLILRQRNQIVLAADFSPAPFAEDGASDPAPAAP
jgi:hypothetical protein